MKISQEIIEEIVRRVRLVANPERIILFGSAATGNMTGDSDIDLLILESNPQKIRKERLRIRQALRRMSYPFDIIIMSTDRFEETKYVIGGLAYPANKYGRVIYEAKRKTKKQTGKAMAK